MLDKHTMYVQKKNFVQFHIMSCLRIPISLWSKVLDMVGKYKISIVNIVRGYISTYFKSFHGPAPTHHNNLMLSKQTLSRQWPNMAWSSGTAIYRNIASEIIWYYIFIHVDIVLVCLAPCRWWSGTTLASLDTLALLVVGMMANTYIEINVSLDSECLH